MIACCVMHKRTVVVSLRLMGSFQAAGSVLICCGRWCRIQVTEFAILWAKNAVEVGRLQKTEVKWSTMVETTSTHMRVLAVMGITRSVQFSSMVVALNFFCKHCST